MRSRTLSDDLCENVLALGLGFGRLSVALHIAWLHIFAFCDELCRLLWSCKEPTNHQKGQPDHGRPWQAADEATMPKTVASKRPRPMSEETSRRIRTLRNKALVLKRLPACQPAHRASSEGTGITAASCQC
mmetsp:Transcript_81076/g.165137  ORF Transcript_81076/g.165137 Transcript_81076/m.165137 type:complete len:131 (+) Transcript_81076:83-475(+)